MGNKRSVEDDKMSDVYVNEARVMGDFLLRREYRGMGDTIEAAAHRAQKKWGAPATILLRLRNRHDMKDMMLSSFASIAEAYQKHPRKLTNSAKLKEHDMRLIRKLCGLLILLPVRPMQRIWLRLRRLKRQKRGS
ncbi:MAG: hypothetical protein AAAC48_15995 [Phyllobacterium sp.]|uniref:hypothetical protein n=1 Tax=Phyllobacterium sp. TaxID=1871046 RepID=UPI0030F16350